MDKPELEPDPPSPQSGVGIDSGGTLTKIVYFRPTNPPKLPDYVQFDSFAPSLEALLNQAIAEANVPLNGSIGLDIEYQTKTGILRFIKIPSTKNLEFLSFCQANEVYKQFKSINITGGGAFKFQTQLDKLHEDTPVRQIDEMVSLVRGLSWLLETMPKEEIFEIDSQGERRFGVVEKISYPFLLANMGSGTSILRIDSPTTYTRVSGSSLGGGTFFGLSSLLTSATTFKELSDLVQQGDPMNVDLTVGDMFDDLTSLEQFGLTADTIACSLGKISIAGPQDSEFKEEDIAAGLQRLIARNTAQIVYLNAKLWDTKHVIFAGGVVQNTPNIKTEIDWGMGYWSGNTMKALFIRHDGYLGALGAFLHQDDH